MDIDKKDKILTITIAGIVTLAMGIGLALAIMNNGDGFEEGKSYALAYTYLSDIKGVGAGRTFDFADRNLPRVSIVVPLEDARGPLVFENPNLKPGTVMKKRIKVAKRVIEGIEYPAYEYVIWGFNFNLKTKQEFIPMVTPKTTADGHHSAEQRAMVVFFYSPNSSSVFFLVCSAIFCTVSPFILEIFSAINFKYKDSFLLPRYGTGAR